MRPSVYLAPKDVRLGQKWLPSTSGSKNFVYELNLGLRAEKPSDSEPRIPSIILSLNRMDELGAELEATGCSRADLARRHGLSRPRVTQLLSLGRLHPEIIAFLRELPPGRAWRGLTERAVRPLTKMAAQDQVDVAVIMLPGFVEHLRRLKRKRNE